MLYVCLMRFASVPQGTNNFWSRRSEFSLLFFPFHFSTLCYTLCHPLFIFSFFFSSTFPYFILVSLSYYYFFPFFLYRSIIKLVKSQRLRFFSFLITRRIIQPSLYILFPGDVNFHIKIFIKQNIMIK